MWKLLDPGETVQTGDIVRYRPGLPLPPALRDILYDVIKTDQHYFVVAAKADRKGADKLDHTIIKYMDVGYHIALEIWSGKSPCMT
jgi:hypothetical protein